YRLITAYARRSLAVTPLPNLPSSILAALRRVSFPISFRELAGLLRLTASSRENLFRFNKSMRKLVLVAVTVCIVLGLLLFYTTTTNVAHSSGVALRTYPQNNGPVSAVAWSPNGQYVATGGWDHTVQVWDTKSGATTPMTIYTGHRELVD